MSLEEFKKVLAELINSAHESVASVGEQVLDAHKSIASVGRQVISVHSSVATHDTTNLNNQKVLHKQTEKIMELLDTIRKDVDAAAHNSKIAVDLAKTSGY